ncbi:DNA (cytosine-5)-methyltransferase 1 [Variovorax boronicumulans]|uniref:DNA cytosine methyltransferase n=1 Tax=Variovorax boronicumulans TaxID=436515 RepID=UPI0027828450|nr:DNA cytosine methyltransferase [Variovorax boronicumulans]MDQ0082884.1 DNA (cytosine-5)-methyltransferase 1 [Variovorax boronicumulans]
MKRDDFTLPIGFADELIIDNFAGGGGTSEGLEQAFGRPVDIAINHDPEALAMHAANHPHTKHLCESVWDVDPIKVTGNQPVGLVWLSPDCKHFSKAKGGKPVEKKIRGLAWVTLRWAAKCKPRVIMLENVEEFKTWGPLLIDADGNAKPDPAKKGKTFDSFVRQLRQHGYDVDWRELRACDLDTPTIRKRFFMVARRDGIKIEWPAATHGLPDSLGVRTGKLKPFRTAAECIDWSIPCASIFERKKPLAEATLRRIAKGIMRYVVDAADPFIVNTANSKTTGRGPNNWAGEEPLRTVTSSPGFAVVAPSIVPVTHQGGDRTEDIGEPMRTVTSAHRGEKALMAATLVQTGYGEREGQAPRALDIEKPLGTVVGGAAKHALVHAFLTEHANASNQRNMPVDEPLRTVCAQVKGGHFSMVSAVLTGVGGRAGQSRPRGVDEPTATATSKYDTAVVTAFMAQHNSGNDGHAMEEPVSTIVGKGCTQGLVTAHITKFRTGATGSSLDEPLHTVTAGPKENPAGAAHAMGIVTANLVHMGHGEGTDGTKRFSHGIRSVEVPLNTVAASGVPAGIVTSSLVKLRGTSSTASMEEPLHTVSAGGQHHAEVRAFLVKYYGIGDNIPELSDPMATVTSKDRFGLVTIQGVDYEIVDIGLRMLAPRELFRAQGFGDDYIIDSVPDWEKLFVDGEQVEDIYSIPWRPLTKSSQVRMCGNSVCPPMARALINANFAHEALIPGRAAA